jgi:hypothetical protein
MPVFNYRLNKVKEAAPPNLASNSTVYWTLGCRQMS